MVNNGGAVISCVLYGYIATLIANTELYVERKSHQMIELPDLESELLRACLFIESFETLVEECKLESKQSVIADAIKNLIHFKLLIATNIDVSLTWVYDSDKMIDSSFKATAKGVEWMELNPPD